ncbi:APC family permease [Brochothrix campestris]|uniref:Amino acid transporter n=1 Tax=Brochothrix campestris FSL F6-1037 TaxID=1265861 RepID=W7CXE1_9LIST|nr:amino acid permease [Brochothrix campestris]EUJ41375.1 amino acid transporter [Brochothrix campestris FSL F6-1037]
MRENELKPTLGIWSALALIIGTIIGSGVFFKPASVLSEVGNTNMALAAWAAGGILTIAAGLTIAEIGTQLPYTGGLYIYMSHIYGKIWGFLSGWMQIVIYGPAIIASLSLYLAVLFVEFFGVGDEWRVPIAIFASLCVMALNMINTNYGAKAQIITTVCKLVPIVAIVIFGLLKGDEAALGQVLSHATSTTAGSFGVAILATLYAYDGWILLSNMAGELKNPQKLLPRAMTIGLFVVMGCYMLINLAIYKMLPADTIVAQGEKAAPFVAILLFGDIGGKLLNIAIIISILGCLNGKIMTFPRIVYAMAKEKDLPFAKQLAYVNPKSNTPIMAIATVMVISIIMMLFFDADYLSVICIFVIYIFYVFAFIGVFILRRRNKNGPQRSYRVPLYPITPIVAILGSVYIIWSQMVADPKGVIISIAIVLVGIPVYLLIHRKKA